MLIDFFYTLRAAKLPVSVKEFLMLLEALQNLSTACAFALEGSAVLAQANAAISRALDAPLPVPEVRESSFGEFEAAL